MPDGLSTQGEVSERDRALIRTPAARALRGRFSPYLPLLKMQHAANAAALPSFVAHTLSDLLAALDLWGEIEDAN